MNCTLTLKQQKLLLGKVAIDLKNSPSFDFKSYSKDFFNNISSKTGDKVLAANYVTLLPMNIRAVMGVDKSIFRKLSTAAGQISDFEARFEDFANVEDFVNTFGTEASDIVKLQKTLQQQSLTVPPQQTEIEVKKEIIPIENLSLSDIPMDDDKDNFLKPDMKLYADVKEQLIKNIQKDGSSILNGRPVRLTVISTRNFRVGDFYPDTQRAINSGDEKAVQGSKTGVVLAVTNLDGTPTYFNDKLEPSVESEGKIVYYTIRKPVEGAMFNQADKAMIQRIQKDQGLTQAQAEAAVTKKLDLIRKVRDYISSDPNQNKVGVNLTGGVVNYATKVAKNKTTISALNMKGGLFTPYKGIETKGQKPNVYYFDYPGSNITMPINSPSVPQELVQKLTQLLSEDVSVKAGTERYKFGNAEKIKLFNQFIYVDKDVFDMSVNESGDLVVKKLGVTVSYSTKEDFTKDIQELLTRKVLTRKISAEEAKGKTKVVDLRGAMYKQVYQQILPNGNANYYMVGQVQLKVNDTAFKNNLYTDFNLIPSEQGFAITTSSKPYYPFIAENFLLSYETDSAGNLQTAGSILNFEIQPDDLLKLQQVNKQQVEKPLETSKKITKLVTETTKHELQDVISGKSSVRYGELIQAITSYLKASEGSSEKSGGRKSVSKEGEESRLREYISKNNLWSKIKLGPLTEIGKGMEQLVYLSEDNKHVYKVNNLSAYANWEEYFNNLLLHNYFFPDTAYELIGFTEKNPFPNSNIRTIYANKKEVSEHSGNFKEFKIFPIVRQKFVQADEDINLDDIDRMLEDKGFKKPSPIEENYYHPDLGIELRDLHRKNVLSSNKIPYFIDTIFQLRSNFYEEQAVSTEKKLTPQEKLKQARKDNLKKFDKLIGQKGLDATIEQIDAAEKWYNNHPMSSYFPFETLFNVVNQESSNSIATWTVSGITLYKGADYSDLYHEAWHGFTQGFLNKEEKTGLYNETKKKSGTFVDYTGKLVAFKNATDLQVEEFLAEDFREYMLSGATKVLKDSPKRNTIFRRIWNFLRQLFGDSTVNQNVADEQVTQNVRELYEKLRVGDLNSYTFAAENRNFDTLNKALQAVNKDEVENSLSFENSNLIYSTVESLFSEGVDVMNQANIDDINERRELQAKPNLTEADKKKLAELNSQITAGYTTLLLSTPKGVRSLYEYTKGRLEDQRDALVEQNTETPSTSLQKNIDLLNYTLRNFGDLKTLYTNRRDEGVIGYHMYKSGLIQDDLFADLNAAQRQEEDQQEIEELTGRETEGKNYLDRGGNERSIFDLAIREVRNIVGSLNKTDVDGTVINNTLGFPELVNYREAFAQIARITQNSKNIVEMQNKLQQASESYPPIKQLLNKLGPIFYEGQTDREVDLWSKFYQTFNKYRILLVQTTVNEQEVVDENGNKKKSTFDIKIGNALSDYKRVDQDWRAAFAKANTNSFIKNDIKGNYLDVVSVLDKYPSIESVNANPLQFLNDIGIKMKGVNVIKTELDKAIKSGSIRLNGIYSNLQKYKDKGVPVRGLGAFLSNNSALGIIGQTGLNSNYGKLLIIQTKYSGDYSDFMVQNAAGDPQSEFSQNNTLTQLVKQINSVGSYNELVANASTAHYNNAKDVPGRPYNPFVNSSIWINSLFNMTTNGGPKYDNEIVIENLSGINSSINDSLFDEGVAASKVDEVGKLLNDFHIQLMKFTPELTRHAGKKTSLAVSLRNYKTGARNAKLYVDTENFVNNVGEFNKGFDDFQKIVVKYIGAELNRVNYAKYLLTPEADVKEFDFSYLNRGTKFVAFVGVLSEETKNALYDIKVNLSDYLNSPEGNLLSEKIYDEVYAYFNGLVDGVNDKMKEYDFISPSLIEKTKADATKIGKQNITDESIRKGLMSSFVANNWIHHFEEMIMLYGDIALYKDFFKRNASLNSTGDIIRNDEFFIKYANNVLGKPFAKQAGATSENQNYNGILNTAVVSDVLVKSVYVDEYRKAVNSPVIDQKYGDKGVNEADAQGMISFDTYRIVLKGLGKWTNEQERIYQNLLAGTHASDIEDPRNFFPTLKMGMFGPLQTEYLPVTGLHKFALFPLISGVIPQNLQKLHEKMMKEGIDYLTFESGSKVGTITKKGGLQPLYSDLNKRELSETPFVKNKVFSDYLKYQVEATPKFKGKMTFPTQLRKLAELGLMDNGVPTDYKGTNVSWDSLSESKKKEASKNYTLRQNYLDSLKDLVEAKKSQLLKDIGWKRDKNGNIKGDMSSLLELISRELKRSDVGEHEWAYIQTIHGQDIKNSLDISQSAEMIEKVITSLVNKRLVNMKVNGEQLVMVSTTGFENVPFAYGKERNFEKPTDEDLQKYGTNDLPTYHIRNGKIAAAKVKIAIQGDFKKLLDLKEVSSKAKELGISKLEALNSLLKDEEWLNTGDNRAMISMVGARIPTQGPNSADFTEVYEFLPEIAGNIIIAPSEVTSKGGPDFDYDKLPLMMPNIRVVNGKVELAKKYNEEQAKEAYKMLLKENIHKMTFKGLDNNEIRLLLRTSDRFEKIDKIVADLLGPDYYEELAKIVQEESMTNFEDFYENLNGTKVIENSIMTALKEILERPENFVDLIRPNETDLVKPFADDIYTAENGTKSKTFDKEGTRMFEVLHNMKVQQSNSIGKDTLGIGAISNSFNAVFNGVGLTLNPFYGKKNEKRADILLPHNKKDQSISLSNRFDGLNQNNIADVISQLINGWVDVEKDDWISYIQGNKEIAPVMLFMVQAGVPIKDVVYFVTQPLVKEYVKEQRVLKSNFAKVLGKGFTFGPRVTAKKNILENPLNGFNLSDTKPATVQKETVELTDKIGQFKTQDLVDNVKKFAANKNASIEDFDKAAFLHFLEIEDMSKEVDKVIRAFNVDTTTLQNMTEFYGKIQEINGLDENTLVPKEYIERIKKNSPIGPFYVQQFALDLFGRVLPLRNSVVINEFLNSLDEDQRKTVSAIYDLNDEDARNKFYQTFKNDLFSYVFQNQVRFFNPTSQTYHNHKVDFGIKEVEELKFGAFVKDNVLYVDKAQLEKDYNSEAYAEEGYGNRNLALVGKNAFVNKDEYEHFVYERETLRSLYPFNAVNGTIDFNEFVKENERKDELRKEGETTEDFIKRIEKLSYEELLRDKALYNIFNPYQLFKSRTNAATTYGFILNKYPALKDNFSILNNIKVTSKDGFTNLMPSVMKFTKDEIDTFYENFKDLANSNKLLRIEGIDQRDADYISSFFTKLPFYLYMQSGPNIKNAFSFARIIPQDRIQRILKKPVKQLTESIDNDFLNEFLNRFVVANSNKSTRNRFKEFLKSDKLAVKIKSEIISTDEDKQEGNKIVDQSHTTSEPKIITDEEINDLMNRCFLK